VRAPKDLHEDSVGVTRKTLQSTFAREVNRL
jgi:hypothetical protein